MDGSQETVPMFLADISAGRIISLGFALVLLLIVGFLRVCVRFCDSFGPHAPLYSFLVDSSF